MISADTQAYVDRLLRAILRLDRDWTRNPEIGPFEKLREELATYVFPMLAEWNALPYLPPPDMFVIADALLKAVDRDGVTIDVTVKAELEGTTYSPVRQARKARAIAILCPTPSLEGCFTGRVSDVRSALKNESWLRRRYQEVTSVQPERPLSLDIAWCRRQAETWSTKEVREFLGQRLRPREVKKEMIRAGAQGAAQALVNTLKAFVDSAGRKLESIDSVLDHVRSRPSGDLAEAVLRRVLPIVALEEPLWATQEAPTGGYSDIATRGSFDRLLISNFCYPEDEFARRLVDGELLFYELETPPSHSPPKQFVFLDASPGTWGVPRLAGAAVGLCVENRARERKAESSIRAAGRMDRPFERLDTVHGVNAVLDYARWNSQWKSDLAALVETVRTGIRNHPTGADVFICTEAARIPELDEWLRTAEVPPRARIHVFATDQIDGHAALWRREGNAFVPIATLSLAAADLLPQRPESLSPGAARPLAVTDLAIAWDWGSNVSCAAIAGDGLAATGHENGEIHLWDSIVGRHLGHHETMEDSVSALAIAHGVLVVATLKSDFKKETSPSLWALSISPPVSRVPIPCAIDRSVSPLIKPGWERNQFFWWESDAHLIEYRADTREIRRHPNCRKLPKGSFAVRPAEKKLMWRGREGKVLAYDLRTLTGAPPSLLRDVLMTEVRHQVYDSDGNLVARMSRQEKEIELLWLDPAATERRGERTIRGGQHPKALSASADRLLTTNSNALWFYRASEGKVISKHVGTGEEAVALKVGRTPDSPDLNAIKIEYRSGNSVQFRWHPQGARDKVLGCDHGYGGNATRFIEHSSHPRSAAAIPLGKWTVGWISDRQLYLSREGGPQLRLWLSMADWILASENRIAGSDLSAVTMPPGVYTEDWMRLAHLLQEGVESP